MPVEPARAQRSNAVLLYIAMQFLRYTEREAWKKTPYQITRLFKIHREFHPEKFKPEPLAGTDELDDILDAI